MQTNTSYNYRSLFYSSRNLLCTILPFVFSSKMYLSIHFTATPLNLYLIYPLWHNIPFHGPHILNELSSPFAQ